MKSVRGEAEWRTQDFLDKRCQPKEEAPTYYYRRPNKLREGNVFTGVCLSTGRSWVHQGCARFPEILTVFK